MSNSLSPEPGTERVLRSTARNPRRRPRQSDTDSLKATAPRRKRSKIGEDTFRPRESTEIDEVNGRVDNGSNIEPTNGHIHHPNGTSTGRRPSNAILNSDLVVRGGKKASVKRNPRHETGKVLAQNAIFTVKELPGTPKELKKHGLEYRGSLGNGSLALAITHEQAIIWDYTASIAASNPRVFDVPFPTRADEPLPLGALVSSNDRASEAGLLLISAMTGDAVYYESIDSAASFGLFEHQRVGINGSVGKLTFGESVTELVFAESAGYIVVFSSGRLAQLTLRDSQGRPRIYSQFLKIAETNTRGLLGSIRGYLGASHRRDTTAAHVRSLDVRGQMQVISLTESATFLIWNIDWSGRADYRGSIDFKDMLIQELKQMDAPELAGNADNVAALDFAFVDQPLSTEGQEVATIASEKPLDMTVLLRVGQSGMCKFVLADISLIGEKPSISRLSKVQSYYTQGTMDQQSPKLAIPKPGHTAYITFDTAITLAKTQEPAEATPEAQLHASYLAPESFEDTVYLRPKKHLAFQSTVLEHSISSQASCVAFVKSYGLVRISVNDEKASSAGVSISAKSKIEQAVFHGTLQADNILDFSRKPDTPYDVDAVEAAVLDVSDDILRANTPYSNFISTSPTSMDVHLTKRAQALKALIDHVRDSYPALPRSTLWRLLWDAERIAAGQQLWTAFEQHVASTSREKRKATLLDELCAWFVARNEPFTLRTELSNEDPVRKFFIAGLHHLEALLSGVPLILEELGKSTSKKAEDILRLTVQANDVWLSVLGTAFAFRSEHAGEYGILSEHIVDGLLVEPTDFVDLPEFWTSTRSLVDATAAVAHLSRELSQNFFENEDSNEETDTVISPLAQEVCADNPRLVRILCLQSEEAISWCESRPSQKEQQHAQQLRRAFQEMRNSQIRGLAEVAQADAGMQIAEKYRDMNTLTDMVIAEDEFLYQSLAVSLERDKAAITKSRLDLETRIRRYFERYGEAWSRPFFDKAFSGAMPGINFVRAQLHWTKALGEYLKANPARAKLCWINDVTVDQDFQHAADSLMEAAKDYETHLWAKRVELSMSKLAVLAAAEATAPGGKTKMPTGATKPPSYGELALVDMQEQVYAHIRPDLDVSLDREAAPLIYMDKYGSHVGHMSSLRQLLKNGIEMVLDHTVLSIEELIDVLTLMNSVNNEELEQANLDGAEFFLALSALDAAAADLPSSRFEMLLQLIWQRCYTYDDWKALHVSGKQSDTERRLALRQTIAWQTLYHCIESGTFAAADTHVRILAPSECIGAACSHDDLRYRFPDEDLREPILRDIRTGDALLQSYVADRHLDEVIEECKRDAVDLMQERRFEEQALLAQQEKDGEAVGFRSQDGINGYANGHAEVPNGANARDFKVGGSSSDVDGDVEMA